MIHLVYLICAAWHSVTELSNAWNLWYEKTAQPENIQHTLFTLLVLSICVGCSSDCFLHYPIQAALCASAFAKSFSDQAQSQWHININLHDGTVFALKACVWVMVMENYHLIEPLWVEVWSVHALVLTSARMKLFWGSFNVWYLQRMLCAANAANSLLKEKRYKGPGVFGKGCDKKETAAASKAATEGAEAEGAEAEACSTEGATALLQV